MFLASIIVVMLVHANALRFLQLQNSHRRADHPFRLYNLKLCHANHDTERNEVAANTWDIFTSYVHKWKENLFANALSASQSAVFNGKQNHSNFEDIMQSISRFSVDNVRKQANFEIISRTDRVDAALSAKLSTVNEAMLDIGMLLTSSESCDVYLEHIGLKTLKSIITECQSYDKSAGDQLLKKRVDRIRALLVLTLLVRWKSRDREGHSDETLLTHNMNPLSVGQESNDNTVLNWRSEEEDEFSRILLRNNRDRNPIFEAIGNILKHSLSSSPVARKDSPNTNIATTYSQYDKGVTTANMSSLLSPFGQLVKAIKSKCYDWISENGTNIDNSVSSVDITRTEVCSINDSVPLPVVECVGNGTLGTSQVTIVDTSPKVAADATAGAGGIDDCVIFGCTIRTKEEALLQLEQWSVLSLLHAIVRVSRRISRQLANEKGLLDNIVEIALQTQRPMLSVQQLASYFNEFPELQMTLSSYLNITSNQLSQKQRVTEIAPDPERSMQRPLSSAELANSIAWALGRGAGPATRPESIVGDENAGTATASVAAVGPRGASSSSLLWKPRREGQRGLRILSLDGGGSRGILSLSLLAELFQQCLPQRSIQSPNRPSEHFDLICGTSTGGIIASLFVLKQLSIDESLTNYDTFVSKVFARKRSHLKFFSSKSLYCEKEFESLLDQLYESDFKLLLDSNSQTNCPRIVLVSANLMEGTPSVHLWRNYEIESILDQSSDSKRGHDISMSSTTATTVDRTGTAFGASKYRGSCRISCKDAIRATTAAPMLFAPVLHSNKIYCDGAIVANNPTAIAIQEAKALFPGVPIELVVSVGTGIFHEMGHHLPRSSSASIASVPSFPRSNSRGHIHDNNDNRNKANAIANTGDLLSWSVLLNQLVASTVNTEHVHETLSDLLPDSVYYRFNPVLQDRVAIDEIDPNKLQELKGIGKKYMQLLFARTAQKESLTHLKHLLQQPKR